MKSEERKGINYGFSVQLLQVFGHSICSVEPLGNEAKSGNTGIKDSSGVLQSPSLFACKASRESGQERTETLATIPSGSSTHSQVEEGVEGEEDEEGEGELTSKVGGCVAGPGRHVCTS